MENYKYKDHSFELLQNSEDQSGELEQEDKAVIALWRAVITQALMDAGSQSKKSENKKAKQEAIDWLTRDKESFLSVCAMADMCPDYVREKALWAIERGCRWRNDGRSVEEPQKPPLKIDTKSSNVAADEGGYDNAGFVPGLASSVTRDAIGFHSKRTRRAL